MVKAFLRSASSITWARAFRLALLPAILVALAALPPTLAPAATGNCRSSGPTSGAYTVTLCFDAPTEGELLTGTARPSVSVTVTGENPGIRRTVFYLNQEYLLTDYASPYTFILPTHRWLDGSYQLEVEALMRDGFTSARTGIGVVFDNGVTTPPMNRRSFTPSAGTTPAAGQPFVVAAVGDGASGEPEAAQVTDLIASWSPNLLLYLGDVYERGSSTEFYNWYGQSNSFFGRFRSITNPSPGNHEYITAQAAGYFNYWDNVPHYYSVDTGGWHFVSLDSTTNFHQTAPGSAQYQWLDQDLAASSAACTIVYYHHPRYSVGIHGDTTSLSDIWSLLYERGVDLVLSGHDHAYQRWSPLDGAGQLDPAGLTQFVVGSGGHGIRAFTRTDSRLAVGVDRRSAYGALRLELYPDQAAYQFIDVAGAVLDSGSVPCRGGLPSPTPTATPTVTPTPTATPVRPEVVLTPVADAYVDESNPTVNYGRSTALRADASPVVRSYLRFDVQGLGAPVAQTTLRVYANAASSAGYDVRAVTDNTWDEAAIAYASAPPVSATPVGSSGPLSAGGWHSVDVTSLVTGEGTWGLALTGPSSSAISLASRESGANAPQLVIGLLPPPTATPTPVNSMFTFTPIADAYVNESFPSSNFGSGITLRSDASPNMLTYLRFDLQGLSGVVTRATLRIYANGGSAAGYEVRGVADNTWDESTVTYTSAPAVGPTAVGSSGAFSVADWTTVDVTPLAAGNGTLSLALTTVSPTAISFASRETGANAPQLIVETGGS